MSILNTSVSGMSADQNWLSSISQNVANANTTGYKDLDTDFSTMVDQASGEGTAQGAGVQTSTVSLNALQGSVVSTQTATNLAVQGAGFFVVSDSAGNLYLTRNGSFVPDSSGNLVNGAGYYLMADNVQDGQSVSSNSLSSLQKVNVDSAGLTAQATTSGSLAVNLPSTDTTTSTPDQTSLVVYNSLGAAQTVDLTFTNTGANTWMVDASVNGTSVGSPNSDVHRRRASERHDAYPERNHYRLDDPHRSQRHDAARDRFHRSLGDRQRKRACDADRRLDRCERDALLQLLERDVGRRIRHSARQCREPRQSRLRQRRRLHGDRCVRSDLHRIRGREFSARFSRVRWKARRSISPPSSPT